MTEADYAEAKRLFLRGVVGAGDAHDMVREAWDLHPRYNTFPGEVYMRLAAEALHLCGAGVDGPIQYEGLLAQHLPECEFRGRDNQKIKFALHAAAALNGGLEADLLDEVQWWRTDDYWQYALYAAVALTRAAAVHMGADLPRLVEQVAARNDIDLTAETDP